MTTIYGAMAMAEGLMFRFSKTGSLYGYPQGRALETIAVGGVEFPPYYLCFSAYDKWTRPEKENEICVRLDFGFPHDINARAEWTLYLGQDGYWCRTIGCGHNVPEWHEEEDRIDDVIKKIIEEKNSALLKFTEGEQKEEQDGVPLP